MLIYTCMQEGRVLQKEVLEGIILNDCDLAVYTNTGIPSERAKTENIRRMLEKFDGDKFLLMDCDVVLPTGCIDVMISELKNYSVVTIPTKLMHTPGAYPDVMCHSAMIMRKEMIETFQKYLDIGGCCVCAFLRDYPAKVLWEQRGYEV